MALRHTNTLTVGTRQCERTNSNPDQILEYVKMVSLILLPLLHSQSPRCRWARGTRLCSRPACSANVNLADSSKIQKRAQPSTSSPFQASALCWSFHLCGRGIHKQFVLLTLSICIQTVAFLCVYTEQLAHWDLSRSLLLDVQNECKCIKFYLLKASASPSCELFLCQGNPEYGSAYRKALHTNGRGRRG